MAKSRRKTGTFDRNDIYRALLTETLPGDLPIVVSNDGLRANVRRLLSASPDMRALVERTVTDADIPYTVPYRYKIAKTSESMRQLSLAHPASQISVCRFYDRYSSLMTYYASRGNFSIRHPAKVGSRFFYLSPLADLNKYRKASVDPLHLDTLLRNPSSYFVYGGHVRFHHFFDSQDYLDLEKKFSDLAALDVSKCFSSIYTHTLTWSVKDRDAGKKNTNAKSFGNAFDRLMQQLNFNETNGIIVGPEVSRIFAEIILQSVDIDIEEKMKVRGFTRGIHFECRRYVDDYLVFTNDETVLKTFQQNLADSLGFLNLHLNEHKIAHLKRPFQTRMSAISDAVFRQLEHFWDKVTQKTGLEQRLSLAMPLKNPPQLLKSFIRDVKTACYENDAGYDQISGLLVAALDIRIQRLIDTWDKSPDLNDDDLNNQVGLMLILLEASFFFYSVHPTVSSSFKIAKSIVLVSRFVSLRYKLFEPVLFDSLRHWMTQFLEAPERSTFDVDDYVNIEKLNILVCISELPSLYSGYFKPHIDKILNIKSLNYFSIVSCLFVMRNNIEFLSSKSKLEKNIAEWLFPQIDLKANSKDLHITLDLLSCPYLSHGFRDRLLSLCFQSLGLPPIGRPRRRLLLAEFKDNPWFVRWGKLDLLNSIEKGELNAVY